MGERKYNVISIIFLSTLWTDGLWVQMAGGPGRVGDLIGALAVRGEGGSWGFWLVGWVWGVGCGQVGLFCQLKRNQFNIKAVLAFCVVFMSQKQTSLRLRKVSSTLKLAIYLLWMVSSACAPKYFRVIASESETLSITSKTSVWQAQAVGSSLSSSASELYFL
jgi:hypothetical protein